jgi:hypothetical protein
MKLAGKDPAARLEEIRASLKQTRDALVGKRAELGVAVADDDAKAMAALRREVASQEARITELESAVPVAERRLAEAQAREQRRRRAEEARRLNAQREVRLAAAAKVDEALHVLGDAYRAYQATTPDSLTAHAAGYSVRAAVRHWADELARALEVQPIRQDHRRPLAAIEADLNAVHEVSE